MECDPAALAGVRWGRGAVNTGEWAQTENLAWRSRCLIGSTVGQLPGGENTGPFVALGLRVIFQEE